MVIILAGRRVDADDAEQIRFPLSNIELVRKRIEQMLVSLGCQHLFCSGACGVDLLALQVAKSIGIKRHLFLPFNHQLFRSISVLDRPGDWGDTFDKTYEELKSIGELYEFDYNPGDDNTYIKTNKLMIEIAIEFSDNISKPAVKSVIVWDGQSYGDQDTTDVFRKQSVDFGLDVCEILTL